MLERVRAVAHLTHEQRNDWEYFKVAWHKAVAEAHGEDWAKLVADMI